MEFLFKKKSNQVFINIDIPTEAESLFEQSYRVFTFITHCKMVLVIYLQK
jgi:hypothetical protein